MGRTRKTHSKEFKAELVGQVRRGGKMPSEVARANDIAASLVAKWVAQEKVDDGVGGVQGTSTAECQELSRPRKENRELRMERHMLKKATAFFAKHST